MKKIILGLALVLASFGATAHANERDQASCNQYGCYQAGGGCNQYGCYRCGGSCNQYGCTDNGVCTQYGCP